MLQIIFKGAGLFPAVTKLHFDTLACPRIYLAYRATHTGLNLEKRPLPFTELAPLLEILPDLVLLLRLHYAMLLQLIG